MSEANSTPSPGKNIFVRKPREQRRVVVTGIGALTPLGNNVSDSWNEVISGKSGITRITQFDPETFSSQIAGEVKNFDPGEIIQKKELKKMDRFIQLSLVAAHEAMKDSGVVIDDSNSSRAGTLMGVGMGGLPFIEAQHSIYLNRGPGRLSPFYIPSVISNLCPGHLSIQHGLKGLNYAVTSACASGAHAIGESYRYIRDGLTDIMVSGGSESCICPTAVGGFAAMKALSTRNENPEQASRPYDTDRDGFVIAEASSVLVLEDYESAARRGAKIYAEIRGYGASSDAFHLTNPEPSGDGAYRAMKMALEDSELNVEEIGYVNAHGTSTPVGDGIEIEAVKRILGGHSKKAWVSSTKSMTGHALGAAGSMEAVFCLKTLETGVVPPTINLDSPSDGCDLDLVPHTARENKEIKAVLNNSFGFGGTNASLIFSKV